MECVNGQWNVCGEWQERRKMVGARGFELCPLAPSCPIFNELQKQIGAVHTLFTVSSEKLN